MLETVFVAVGSVAGLISAVFLIWERFVRDRPFAFFDPRPHANYPGAGTDIYLVISNPADRPILVSLPPDRSPGIAFSDGIGAEAAVRLGLRVIEKRGLTIVVPAKGRSEVEISRHSIENAGEGEARLRLKWRPSHFGSLDPARWLRSDIVMISTFADLRHMTRENADSG